MRALTIEPGRAHSARLEDIPEPDPQEGAVLVRTLCVGLCGTDRDLFAGEYGEAPAGEERLVPGHESLGEVLEAPRDSGLSPGDLVVGIVRRPDPVPCSNCAVGEWDMCRNGRYTEHGIKRRHGFCRERFRLETGAAVKLDGRLRSVGVLLEPASILAKAWAHIENIGARARWTPKRVLVTGAGPIGLFAALLGAQRGLEVHVLDRAEGGLKPQLVTDLGGHYHTGSVGDVCPEADVVIECTGAPSLVFDVMRSVAPNGIVCLTGISSGVRKVEVDANGLNRSLVLENNVVFGTVNANRLHYELAAEALARTPEPWLERLITRQVPIERWDEALGGGGGSHVKTVIQF
jgi:glucose 1-dehydrogenase